MRTVKKPETRKREILAGAMTVFLRSGYERTTIGDIARELGISQGLCYRYFASKEEIYDAVIDTYAALIAEENLKTRPKDQPIRQWIESIPQMLRRMSEAEKENAQMYALVHNPQNWKMHQELCMRVGQKLLPAVTEVLEQAKKTGQIRISDCEKTATFGIYGEIGLLISPGEVSAGDIQENWRMLLGIDTEY